MSLKYEFLPRLCTRCGLITHEVDECILPAEFDAHARHGEGINDDEDMIPDLEVVQGRDEVGPPLHRGNQG